ncbi:uncharacterized protein LOC9629390 [Selaginella moellendorffii]|uniref:uncharacterized protein LOC9629390 n=1 Tax=Selaginella moellendorffii TaxID=88036 RepID=UPI000D1CCAA9|nr:uncharacterized protein LOC9629390 [Selaginella moellendorffii]XP_024536068.1 uncharacterized protein LOC9629390 [Selaginella moellendorffii]|eukprot:XP_024536067.1 uncharacterized protein LOC9629390 [Selaginella moellendorffii]
MRRQLMNRLFWHCIIFYMTLFERELTAEQDQYEGKNLAQQKQIERELSLEWTVILENPLNLEEQYEGKNPAQQE